MPPKQKKSGKAGAVAPKKGTPGKASLFPGGGGQATPPPPEDSAQANTRGGGIEFFPPKPELGTEIVEISIADMRTAIAEREQERMVGTLGRSEEYTLEKHMEGFSEALQKWRNAHLAELMTHAGPTYGRPWMRGPKHGLPVLIEEFIGQWEGAMNANADVAIYWTRIKGGGDWTVIHRASREDWIESLIAMLRNPLVPRATALKRNAKAFQIAAENGDVEFFERVSDVFRRPERVKTKEAGGSAKSLILHFWISAGLWRFTVPEACRRLDEIVTRMKQSGFTDSITEIVKTAFSKLEPKAYAKAKERMRL